MNATFQITPAGKQIIFTTMPGFCARCKSQIFEGDQVRFEGEYMHCGAKWVCDMQRANGPMSRRLV